MMSDLVPSTVMRHKKPLRNDIHTTMKPVPLLADQIKNSSRPGEIVADGFLGSGTTMVACEQLGRKCYAMEDDPRYCHVIVERMLALNPDLTITKNGESYELPNRPEASAESNP
jgi:DNA modification methylase